MIIQYFKQFFSLSFSQKRELCRALYGLSIMVVQIKYRTMHWFWDKNIVNASVEADIAVNDERLAQDIHVAEELYESIRLASRLLPFSCECVPRSLVLRDMLHKKGIFSKVQIGVKKENVNLQSHAWVEVHGEAIGENGDLKANFTRIDPKNKIGSE